MIVLVCGDRNWTNKALIKQRLSEFINKEVLIVEGGATGADLLAKVVATELGISVREEPADWNKYGKAAGPIRNRKMLDLGPNLLIAFHNNLAKSKGTRHCVQEARRRKIPVEVIRE